MNTHTKGLWVAHGRYIKQDFSFAGLGEESGCCIANIPGGNNSGPFFIESDAECDANARRIVECVNGYNALLDRIAELEEAINLFVEDGRYVSVDGGDIVVSTCESLELAEKVTGKKCAVN